MNKMDKWLEGYDAGIKRGIEQMQESKKTINNKIFAELKKQGFGFETVEDIIFYLLPICEFLKTHNKNYTKEQFHKIETIAEIIASISKSI